jgi:hypothetical protein
MKTKSIRVQKEENSLKTVLKSHPTILLNGTSGICLKRALDSIVDLYRGILTPEEIKVVYLNNHPDIFWVDGRQLKADDARELRTMATTNPARWDRKYMILTYLDRPHPTVVPILLKVVEEPPDHFTTILATDNISAIPPTIPSRSLVLKIALPMKEEIESILGESNIEDPAWRASVCGGDPDVAQKLEVSITRNWHKIWAGALSGTDLSTDFTITWTEILNEEVEGRDATLMSCWEILIQLSAQKIHSIYWLDIAKIAMRERDRTRRGRSNKIYVMNAICSCYALARTAIAREK